MFRIFTHSKLSERSAELNKLDISGPPELAQEMVDHLEGEGYNVDGCLEILDNGRYRDTSDRVRVRRQGRK